MSDFARILRARRTYLDGGMTQQELARRIGVAREHIAAIEAGRRNPTGEQIYALAEALRFDKCPINGDKHASYERSMFILAGLAVRSSRSLDEVLEDALEAVRGSVNV